MSTIDNALLILGSPRALNKSTSYSLSIFLLAQLEAKGISTSFIHVQRAVRNQEGMATLLCCFERAELIVLSCPLYVDSLPAPVVRVMEMLSTQHLVETSAERRLAAIVNCGFPEARHTEIALAICRCFANQTGLRWVGGLGLGGGEALKGRRLEEAGGLARNIRRSLLLTADSLSQGKPIPEKACQLISKPLVPYWLYRWLGQRGWKRQGKRYGVGKDLMARPYE
ncbi:MAG: hypothetical protein ACWGQW_17110 [bacterium]